MEKALSGAESLTPLPLFAREPLANDQRRGRGAEQEQHRRCRDGGGRAAARSARSAVMPAAAAMMVAAARSEEHTSELQSLMRISYAVFCLKKKKTHYVQHN